MSHAAVAAPLNHEERIDQASRCAAATDAQIVHRVLAGDNSAYGELVERYERVVLASALAVIADVNAAQDVTQDAFVQCFLKLGHLRNGERFGAWLLKIAHREAVRAAMQNKRRQKTVVLGADATAQVEEQLFDDERERLLGHVARLPQHERLMVSLRYFGGHGVGEISKMTSKPLGTVTKQLSRAIQRLRERMQRSDPHAG